MERVELIWQMGLASLAETDNELRLPHVLSDNLSREEITFLESQLSEHLGGVPIVSFKDIDMNVYRILRMPVFDRVVSSSAASPGSFVSAVSSRSASASPLTSSYKARSPGKKSKIPRPPNAFILYRQKHHPLLKASNPELHNNDISVILGNQWKKETQETRDKFKALAEELKRQHLLKFPDYQYAPRKPAEKKRRMTARKLAKMQQSDLSHDASNFPATLNFDMTDMEFGLVNTDLQAHNAAVQSSFQNMPSLGSMIGARPPIPNPYESTGDMVEEFNSIFPTQPPPLNPDESPLPHFNSAPQQAAFLNSLIDWEGIQEDWKIVKRSIEKSNAQVAANSKTGSCPLERTERNAFDEELERTTNLFE